MRDPFHPEREMLSDEEAARRRAELDHRWDQFEEKWNAPTTVEERLALTDEMNQLHLDELFAPPEIAYPILTRYLRRTA